MNTLNYRDYPEFMFAIIASYLTPEEGRDIRRCAGKTVYRHNKNGNTYKNGVLHSYDDKPALVTENSQIWFKDGFRHREGDLPAIVKNDSQEWWSNGKLHREGDKPAIVSLSCNFWCKNGLIHRDGDLPAIISSNRTIWYKYGKRHREGGLPAIVTPNFQMWCFHNFIYWESEKCKCLNLLTYTIFKLRRLFLDF